MEKLIYITLFLSCCIFTSCEKESISVIEGYFLDSCSLKPIPPTTLEIWGTYTPRTFYSYKPDEAVGLITTGKNGYFRFEYNYIKSFDGYKFYKGENLFYQRGYETRLKFTALKNTLCAHNIILLTRRSFTNQDTLFFSGSAVGTTSYIVGPFENRQTIRILSRLNTASSGGFLEIDNTAKSELIWGLGTEEYKNVSHIPSYQVPPNIIREVRQYVCGQGDDIYINLRNK